MRRSVVIGYSNVQENRAKRPGQVGHARFIRVFVARTTVERKPPIQQREYYIRAPPRLKRKFLRKKQSVVKRMLGK